MTEARVDILCDVHEDPVSASGSLKPSKGQRKQLSEGLEHTKKKKHDKGQASENIHLTTDSSKLASTGNSSTPLTSESLDKTVNEPSSSYIIQTTMLELVVTSSLYTSTFSKFHL